MGNNSIRVRYPVILLHIVGCIAFLSIPVFSGPHGSSPFTASHDNHYYDEIFEYALTIVFFYLNYYYLIPRFYFRKKYLLFALMAVAGFIIVSTLPELLDMYTPHHPFPGNGGRPPMGPPPPPPFDDSGDNFLHLHGLGPFDENFLKYAAVFIFAITLKVTEKLKQIQREKVNSEIMFLKAQINPHFLFNTLNSIYALAIESGANGTAKAIAQLSGMMRYTTGEASTDTVPLAKEIAYIDNYVMLQRIRLNDRVKLYYAVEGKDDGGQIAPFLLIPFIENAFKYGISTDQDCDIRICITVANKALLLQVTNQKVFAADIKDYGTSIGIDNTRKRLQLLYPGRHDLIINETADTFDISLRILL